MSNKPKRKYVRSRRYFEKNHVELINSLSDAMNNGVISGVELDKIFSRFKGSVCFQSMDMERERYGLTSAPWITDIHIKI